MADINPFAHIKPDARLQQSAVNTSSALDALKQAMAVQGSKNTAASSRQNSVNLAGMAKALLQKNIDPRAASNLGSITGQLEETRQSDLRSVDAGTRTKMGELGFGNELKAGESLNDYIKNFKKPAGTIERTGDSAARSGTTVTEKRFVKDPNSQSYVPRTTKTTVPQDPKSLDQRIKFPESAKSKPKTVNAVGPPPKKSKGKERYIIKNGTHPNGMKGRFRIDTQTGKATFLDG